MVLHAGPLMTTPDPTTVLAEMQARCDAATEGPLKAWGPDASGYFEIVRTYDAGNLSLGVDTLAETVGAEDAEMFAHARTDLPLTIAALQAVLGLHVKATRWGDDDGEYSLDQADYDDSPEDYTHLQPFNVCAECFRIEQSPEIHDDEMPHAILEGLWPCPTVRTITEALKGES